ncbi:hypothetical protein ACTXG7_09580 [Mycolicibacterium sp. Dal123E01]|uniref:hypothetical protein n=1 Tax=Mycolicibacterium sp. Dal123E01 TaxID=3457578 RepID=UPI00403E4B32
MTPMRDAAELPGHDIRYGLTGRYDPSRDVHNSPSNFGPASTVTATGQLVLAESFAID